MAIPPIVAWTISPLFLASLLIFSCTGLVVGSDGAQSSLAPAGQAAEEIADLFFWMTVGGTMIWLIVMALAFYAARTTVGHRKHILPILIIGGGAVVPTFVLGALLIYGLAMMPPLLEPAPKGSLTVFVTGEQWWWRVKYPNANDDAVVLANEIRLPVGEPVEFKLHSADVLHSFWIPALGGKVDMIPGRQTRLKLHPTRTGVFRGVCAEYCGRSHAWMQFMVVVTEKDEFQTWLARQAEVASSPTEPMALRGWEVYQRSGCGACHTIRGTDSSGSVGPDLTHVGSRLSLAAGTLPNKTDDFLRWLVDNEKLKPNVHMPSFRMLEHDELNALASYLDSLE